MIINVPPLWDFKKYGEGVIAAWFKREGSSVKKGDLLCHIMVVKVTYDVLSPVSGKIVRIIAKKGAKVKPGDPLVEIEEVEIVPRPIEEVPAVERRPVTPKAFIPSTPAARRLARELGIDLTQVKGTGPGGIVTEEDVRRFAEQAKPRYKIKPLEGLRKIIADRMSESLRVSAQVTLHAEADITELLKVKEEKLEESGITITDLLVKAVAIALKACPYMNGQIVGDEIRQFDVVNIGVAVATDEGLYVPVVKDADKKDVFEISKEIKELARRAREKTLGPEELTGSTFTVTNLGMYGVDYFTPIINPPEIGILGIGRITDRLVMEDDEVRVKKVIGLSLTFDHRAVDGAPAAEFLKKVIEALKSPDSLIK